MTDHYSVEDLEGWDERIRALAVNFGLDCYPQEFEPCDHKDMIGYMAYSGIPSHYPHWSYGKAYEQKETKYRYGVEGLPYEMVINSDPCVAYLMRNNPLSLQLLTIAHVYGHNDFFKNNKTFKVFTQAKETLTRFKAHSLRVRKYREDPHVGPDKVETVLDAAHALSLQSRRNMEIRKLTVKEQREKIYQKYYSRPNNPFFRLEVPQPVDEERLRRELQKVPLESDEDILLFIRDHNPRLSEWEKDLLTIVYEEGHYFIPQIETKIMNEGWASYWHHRLLWDLHLDQDLHTDFIKHHSQVVRPLEHPTDGINPYYLGWSIWNAIRIYYDGMIDPKLLNDDRHERFLFEEMKFDFEERDAQPPDAGKKRGEQKMFEVRADTKDAYFLENFLTPALMRHLNLLAYEEIDEKESDTLVIAVSNDQYWRQIKRAIISDVGMNSFPVIKVEDANHNNPGSLLLKHYHDGRDLYKGHTAKTLGYIQQLWGGEVTLETVFDGNLSEYYVDKNGELREDTSRKTM